MNNRNLSLTHKVIAVITGALLTGYIWHVRGQHGYGASWGMFCVSATVMLFIYALYGKRKTMNYEMIPLAASFAAITTGGWGTLNSQIGGVLSSSALFTGEEVCRYTPISPWSGVAILVLLGFGWMPLFSIVLGSLFSKREYRFKDYVIFVGVYYLTLLLCNLSISHLVLDFINPQAVECAAEGIADAGYSMSPMKAFIVNLGSASWAKHIPYCRNYFTSIKVISSAIGAFVSSLVVGIVLKDKFNAIFSTLSNIMCGIGISAASLSLAVCAEGKTVFTDLVAPGFIASNAWGIWEYFTGFIFGLGLMLVIVCLPSKYTDKQTDFEYTPLFGNKKFSLIYNMILTVFFTFGVILSRAAAFRITRIFGEYDTGEIILTVIFSVIVFIPLRKLVRKNMVEKSLNTPIDMPVQQFCLKILPIFIAITAVTFFLMGEPGSSNLIFLDYSRLFTEGGLKELWDEGALTNLVLMGGTLVLFYPLYGVLRAGNTIPKSDSAKHKKA